MVVVNMKHSFALFSETSADIGEKLDFLQGCIHNIRHINSFMLMSINRCIDYTKASNGVKLVPRLDTINLKEAINLPLSVLRVRFLFSI